MTDELFTVIGETPVDNAGKAPDRATIDLRLYVQPGAGRASVVGRRRDALHVRVAPPPADGRANAAVEVLIAELLDVPRSHVTVEAGRNSRDKRVRIQGVDLEHVRAQLAAATTAAPPGPAFNQGRIQPKR